ncbi:hypothetical protein CJ030_MR6G011340 [Morella rubra]|uniref:Ig-like domain-containing protein n=1 Tax=Morella rubra TaxID=262757 RepID=A0A6A1VBE6_9ROSI|nr:hypothetical protein CJ030_MR6G011340 [Morella rubra]
MWGTSAEPLASITDKQPRYAEMGKKITSTFFCNAKPKNKNQPKGSSRPQKFVGIWYAWDPHTVVWVANRDAPVFNDSNAAFGIAEDGNLKCKAYSYQAAENRTVRGDIITNNVCWTWSEDPSNLREEYAKGGRNLSVRVAKYEIESTRRSCEPCGTYMIPYPLSTSNSCGDPRYFSFDCDASAGQVSFKAPSGTYRVASIDPNTRKFVIQVKLTNFDWYARNAWQPNLSLPFRVAGTADLGNSVSAYNYGKEISWDPPLEPTCTSAADCNDWPQSTCNATSLIYKFLHASSRL